MAILGNFLYNPVLIIFVISDLKESINKVIINIINKISINVVSHTYKTPQPLTPPTMVTENIYICGEVDSSSRNRCNNNNSNNCANCFNITFATMKITTTAKKNKNRNNIYHPY